MKIQANGSAEFENIFSRISDSKRDFNGLPDPAIAADVGDSSIFWARILDFACISNIFVRISDSGRKWKGALGL